MQVAEARSKAEQRVRAWVSSQKPPVEVAAIGVGGSMQGALLGGLMGQMAKVMEKQAASNPAMPPFGQNPAMAGGPLALSRNFAVMTGVNAALSRALLRARNGVEDSANSFGAGFGAGLSFSIVSSAAAAGSSTPAKLISDALFTGLIFGGFQALFHKLGNNQQKDQEEVYYQRTRGMLATLGLERYEKSFKKAKLTDECLPLLDDSALKGAKIPPGPRLIIRDYISRAYGKRAGVGNGPNSL